MHSTPWLNNKMSPFDAFRVRGRSRQKDAISPLFTVFSCSKTFLIDFSYLTLSSSHPESWDGTTSSYLVPIALTISGMRTSAYLDSEGNSGESIRLASPKVGTVVIAKRFQNYIQVRLMELNTSSTTTVDGTQTAPRMWRQQQCCTLTMRTPSPTCRFSFG